MNTALIQAQSGLPIDSSNAVTIGVPLTTISDSIREAIAAFFPGDRGLHFVALLLGQAQVAQLALPELGEVPVAVVSLKSVEFFARSHRMSKDTALRYLSIFHALGIVHKMETVGVFHIPLTEWRPEPSVLDALDQLISSARSRLASLAKSVKTKFLLLYGSPKSWGNLIGEMAAAIIDLPAYFSRKIGRAKRRLFEMRAARLSERIQNGDLDRLLGALHIGDLTPHAPDRDQIGDLLRMQAPLLTQIGDRTGRKSEASLQHREQNGDRLLTQAPSVEQIGDRSPAPLLIESSMVTQIGDFDRAMAEHEAPSVEQIGDRKAHMQADVSTSLQNVTHIGDRAATLRNVIYYSNYIRENIRNVTSVAELVCEALNVEPTREEIDKFVKLFKRCHDPEKIYAALVSFLAEFYRRDTPCNPAAVFTRRCRDFHESQIDAQASALVAKYSSLPHSEFVADMEKPAKSKFQRYTPTPAGGSKIQPGSPPELEITVSLPADSGMTMHQAVEIQRWVAKGEERLFSCRSTLAPLDDNTWAVVIQGLHTQLAVSSYQSFERSREELVEELLASSYQPGDWRHRRAQ